jgi:predicted nucleic acid-binding protein
MFTIDASVWLNADSPNEPNYAASRALLDRIAAMNVAVFMPTLALVEVAGAISHTQGDAATALEYAESMLGLPFLRWIPLDDPLARRASTLAAHQALRGADAVYAALPSFTAARWFRSIANTSRA